MLTTDILTDLSNAERLAYAKYLLLWSSRPVGNPMTFEEWLRKTDDR